LNQRFTVATVGVSLWAAERANLGGGLGRGLTRGVFAGSGCGGGCGVLFISLNKETETAVPSLRCYDPLGAGHPLSEGHTLRHLSFFWESLQMRPALSAFWLCFLLAASGFSLSLGQQPSGLQSETGRSIDNADAAADHPAASAKAKPQPEALKPAQRIVGTLTRPQRHVQHKDLDKAWAEYDAEIEKATNAVHALITREFNAAADRGSLEAAERWQHAGKIFEKEGRFPEDVNQAAKMKQVVDADLIRAKQAIVEAYDAVVISLTRDKEIGLARAARDEIDGLCRDAIGPVVGKWNWFNGEVHEFLPEGKVQGHPDAHWKADTKENTFIFSWGNGRYIDKMTLSKDGNSMSGQNNVGMRIQATKRDTK
jgi:hypothetical protein